MSVRLDRLQRALYDAFSAAGIASNVVWTRGEVPRESLGPDIVALSLTAGPTPGLRMRTRGRTILPPDSVVVRVLAATVGKRLIVRLNDFDYRHDVSTGQTITNVRDALMAKVVAGEQSQGDVTVLTDGTDGFEIIAALLGGIRSLVLVGGDSEIANDPPVSSGDAVLVTEGTSLHMVNVQAFSTNTSPRNGAHQVAQDALDLLQAEDVVEQIGEEGFAIWDLGAVTDLSGIAGAHWQSRATFDVTLAGRSVFVRPVDQIEELNMTVEAQ